ncbi:MAG TPA: hypothetical protein V6C46_05400 [Coleofasciculaceae cyanobacterium]
MDAKSKNYSRELLVGLQGLSAFGERERYIPLFFMTTPVWFIALERFDQADGDRWTKYIEWSKLPQLKELISLDEMLCPRIIKELTNEDWNYNVQADCLIDFFTDADYLVKRVAAVQHTQILGVSKNPTEEILLNDPRFTEYGFDLIEENRSTSALTNCGGFPDSFSNDELTEVGLLPSFTRAQDVREKLRRNNPNEPHAFCDVWKIWRMEYNK